MKKEAFRAATSTSTVCQDDMANAIIGRLNGIEPRVQSAVEFHFVARDPIIRAVGAHRVDLAQLGYQMTKRLNGRC